MSSPYHHSHSLFHFSIIHNTVAVTIIRIGFILLFPLHPPPLPLPLPPPFLSPPLVLLSSPRPPLSSSLLRLLFVFLLVLLSSLPFVFPFPFSSLFVGRPKKLVVAVKTVK